MITAIAAFLLGVAVATWILASYGNPRAKQLTTELGKSWAEVNKLTHERDNLLAAYIDLQAEVLPIPCTGPNLWAERHDNIGNLGWCPPQPMGIAVKHLCPAITEDSDVPVGFAGGQK